MSIIGRTYNYQPNHEFLNGECPYAGQILRINLSSGEIWVDEPEESFYRKFIGGRNVILYYLLSESRADVDPFHADNLLVFAPGLLTGTSFPGSGRHAVGGKSPLTGALGSCETGGWWGAELKRAGLDAVVIEGKAETPVYIWIHDGKVIVKNASHLWGQTTADVQKAVRDELGDSLIRVAQIGPAGENLVRYASIMHDIGRAAGRSGMGALMGSKNLKALVVRGSQNVGFRNPERVQPVRKWLYANYKDLMGWAISRGTEGSVKPNHDSGTMPINNYRDGVFEGIEHLDGDFLHANFVKEHDTCFRCPVRCKPVFQYEGDELQIDGKFGGPEYETIGALGPMCLVDDPLIVAKANELCAAYGLDTISTGATIAFTMEAHERGMLSDHQDAPTFGDGDSLLQSIHQIAQRNGLGELMAEGSARMAEKLGENAQEMLAVARRQELPFHDPRMKHTMAMGYALSATGADHMHNYNDAFASFPGGDIAIRLDEMGVPNPQPLWGISEEKLEGFYYETGFKNFYDCAVICHFYPYTFQQMADVIGGAGDWDVSPDEINEIGVRAINLGRIFLHRAGFTKHDDTLSPRAFYKLDEGPIAGKALTPEELRHWLDIYYQRMDWDEEGIPTQGTLNDLGLDAV